MKKMIDSFRVLSYASINSTGSKGISQAESPHATDHPQVCDLLEDCRGDIIDKGAIKVKFQWSKSNSTGIIAPFANQ